MRCPNNDLQLPYLRDTATSPRKIATVVSGSLSVSSGFDVRYCLKWRVNDWGGL